MEPAFYTFADLRPGGTGTRRMREPVEKTRRAVLEAIEPLGTEVVRQHASEVHD
jgi:hypothetical protein